MNKKKTYLSAFLFLMILLQEANAQYGYEYISHGHKTTSIVSYSGDILVQKVKGSGIHSITVIDLKTNKVLANFNDVKADLFVYEEFSCAVSNNSKYIAYLDTSNSLVIFNLEKNVVSKRVVFEDKICAALMEFVIDDSYLYFNFIKFPCNGAHHGSYYDYKSYIKIDQIDSKPSILSDWQNGYNNPKMPLCITSWGVSKIFNIETGKCLHEDKVEPFKNTYSIEYDFQSGQFSSDATKYKTCTHAFSKIRSPKIMSCLSVYNLKKFKKLYDITEKCFVRQNEFSNTNKYLATYNENGDLKIWGIKNGTLLKKISAPSELKNQIHTGFFEFDKNDKYILLSCGDEAPYNQFQLTYIYDVITGKLLKKLKGYYTYYKFPSNPDWHMNFAYFITTTDTEWCFWEKKSFTCVKKVNIEKEPRNEFNHEIIKEIEINNKYYLYINHIIIGEYSNSVINYFKD